MWVGLQCIIVAFHLLFLVFKCTSLSICVLASLPHDVIGISRKEGKSVICYCDKEFSSVPLGCLQFVIVVFPDHTHLLFLMSRLLCLCCVVTVKSFPVLAFNVVIITIVRIYT